METKTIRVRVSAAAACKYEQATTAERRKLDALISLRLTDAWPARPLEEVMHEISERAQERGLTDAELERLLREDG